METHPLKKFLQDKGMTQAELAVRLGIHKQHIYHILTGKRWPSYKLALRINRITQIRVDKLLGFNRDPKPL